MRHLSRRIGRRPGCQPWSRKSSDSHGSDLADQSAELVARNLPVELDCHTTDVRRGQVPTHCTHPPSVAEAAVRPGPRSRCASWLSRNQGRCKTCRSQHASHPGIRGGTSVAPTSLTLLSRNRGAPARERGAFVPHKSAWVKGAEVCVVHRPGTGRAVPADPCDPGLPGEQGSRFSERGGGVDARLVRLRVGHRAGAQTSNRRTAGLMNAIPGGAWSFDLPQPGQGACNGKCDG